MDEEFETSKIITPTRFLPTTWKREGPVSVEVDAFGITHPGLQRQNNEDQFYIFRYGRFLETVQHSLSEKSVPAESEITGYGMAVADGMGGKAAGEVASELAISIMVDIALGTPDWIMRLEHEAFINEVRRRAARRYAEVSAALGAKAALHPELKGYGTTLTMCRNVGDLLIITHMGDSRAYLLRHGKLRRLTHDHTIAQELADSGTITPEEAASHHMRHMLTKCLGDHGVTIQPDIHLHRILPGDTILLCTDGLTEMIDDGDIQAVLQVLAPSEQSCQELIDRALQAGGSDNVTAVVAKYTIPELEAIGQQPTPAIEDE